MITDQPQRQFSWVYERHKLEKELSRAQRKHRQNEVDYLEWGRCDIETYLVHDRRLLEQINNIKERILALPHGPFIKPIGWAKIRKLAYERDQGICQVCFNATPWDAYECGHIIDRVAGGIDALENVVVMCGLCNSLKPIHESFEEFEAWRDADVWFPAIAGIILEKMQAA